MEIFQLPPDGNKEEVYARSFLRIAFISEEAPEEGSFRIPVRLRVVGKAREDIERNVTVLLFPVPEFQQDLPARITLVRHAIALM